jgi:hypothetical protein
MRKWRVGTISMGLTLILVGCLLMMGQIQGYNGAQMIFEWWPVILISLGMEILAYVYFSKEENPKLKIDVLSIFIVIFIVLVSSILYAGSYFIKSEFSNVFFDEIGYARYTSTFTNTYQIDTQDVHTLSMNTNGNLIVQGYDGDKIEIEAIIKIANNDESYAKQVADQLLDILEGEQVIIQSKKNLFLEDQNLIQNINESYYVKVPKQINYVLNNRRGDITIKEINGRVTINNGYGEILYQNGNVQKQSLNIQSKGGTVTVQLPKDQKGTFDLISEDGEGISIKDVPLEVQQEEQKQFVKETIGEEAPLIKVDVESGDIRVSGK